MADLIDSARPGEEIEVTGIFTNNFDTSLNSKHGFPVFATVLEAVYVEKQGDALTSTRLSEDEKREIHKLSREPNIGERVRALPCHVASWPVCSCDGSHVRMD